MKGIYLLEIIDENPLIFIFDIILIIEDFRLGGMLKINMKIIFCKHRPIVPEDFLGNHFRMNLNQLFSR